MLHCPYQPLLRLLLILDLTRKEENKLDILYNLYLRFYIAKYIDNSELLSFLNFNVPNVERSLLLFFFTNFYEKKTVLSFFY